MKFEKNLNSVKGFKKRNLERKNGIEIFLIKYFYKLNLFK